MDRKSEDLESLEKVCLPLSLNLSQCLLELQQHQQVVELNDKLLEKHKGNTNVQICAFHLSRKLKTVREPLAGAVFKENRRYGDISPRFSCFHKNAVFSMDVFLISFYEVFLLKRPKGIEENRTKAAFFSGESQNQTC